MNLAIDLGNSYAKIGCFHNGRLKQPVLKPSFDEIPELISKLKPDNLVISSVNQDPSKLLGLVGGTEIVLDQNTPLPISIDYDTPETLGKDRIAAAVGAYQLKPNSNSLVVDVGTCLTYEFINDQNIYIGGAISPGIEMRLKAMHTFTAGLPLVELNNNVNLIGSSTKTALQSGAMHGVIAEIEEIVRMYKDKFSHLRFIICGGWAEEVGNRLKTEAEIYPDLVLIGLNGILEHNA